MSAIICIVINPWCTVSMPQHLETHNSVPLLQKAAQTAGHVDTDLKKRSSMT